MSKETRPAFMLYASDWLSGTADMEAAERGMYINLLCHQWITGELPNDFKKLCRLAGIESKDADATSMLQALLQAKFKHTPSNAYVNARLEEVRERKAAQDQKFSTRAKTAAAARWEKRDSEPIEGNPALNEEMLQASSKHDTSNAKNMLNEHEHRYEYESEKEDENRGVQGGVTLSRMPEFDVEQASRRLQEIYKLRQGKPRQLREAYGHALMRMHGPPLCMDFQIAKGRIEDAAAKFMVYHTKLKTETQHIPFPETWLDGDQYETDWMEAAKNARVGTKKASENLIEDLMKNTNRIPTQRRINNNNGRV